MTDGCSAQIWPRQVPSLADLYEQAVQTLHILRYRWLLYSLRNDFVLEHLDRTRLEDAREARRSRKLSPTSGPQG